MLGLSSRHLRSFVLDSDPIPRALLSIDPTFSFVQSWSAVKGLMQIRQWFTGQPAEIPAVNPARLLYANVGEVYLIKWTMGGGHKVRHTPKKYSALLSMLLQKDLVVHDAFETLTDNDCSVMICLPLSTTITKRKQI